MNFKGDFFLGHPVVTADIALRYSGSLSEPLSTLCLKIKSLVSESVSGTDALKALKVIPIDRSPR